MAFPALLRPLSRTHIQAQERTQHLTVSSGQFVNSFFTHCIRKELK